MGLHDYGSAAEQHTLVSELLLSELGAEIDSEVRTSQGGAYVRGERDTSEPAVCIPLSTSCSAAQTPPSAGGSMPGSAAAGGVAWAETVPRDNAAAAVPTDFVVLRVHGRPGSSGCAVDSVATALVRLSAVNFVVPDVPLTVAPQEANGSPRSPLYRRFRSKTGMSPVAPDPDRDADPSVVGGGADQRAPATDFATVRAAGPARRLASVTDSQHASVLWEKGYSGSGVKVAVFDTGLRRGHPHFRKVKERTNWTNERTLDDGVGHGTFVAGMIASQEDCPGFAPDAELYIFRVFTNSQVSYTSWFLDAFNYALYIGVDVLNLSIGGPDYNDQPFIDKVHELTASGTIIVSAVGNDGPFFGTLNNPADLPEVIGVGGLTKERYVASFSSRGMTTWELPHGHGRVKPDIMTLAQHLYGSRIVSGCRSLSGTSVASPVVAGAVALLASVISPVDRKRLINPASMKQALIESAVRSESGSPSIFEQGSGQLNLLGAFDVIEAYTPRVSTFPASLDFTDCPYMWPFCLQPLFLSGSPAVANITILNGIGVLSELVGAPEWRPGVNGERIVVRVGSPEDIWPWAGGVGVSVRVANVPGAESWSGVAEGVLVLRVGTVGAAEHLRVSEVAVPVRAKLVERPPRHRRVLWDQFHSIQYPSGYIPRDDLDVSDDILDWHGDHLHTNYRLLYKHLREEGYFVDILGKDWTCFDAEMYGTLLLVDPEEEYFGDEVEKLLDDVKLRNLSVLVMADWYDVDIVKRSRFFDENTRSWWQPVTGGSNLPALNEVLGELGIAFGDRVYSGRLVAGSRLLGQSARFSSGNSIARFPAGGYLSVQSLSDQSTEITGVGETTAEVPVAGVYDVRAGPSSGRIAVVGDSDCASEIRMNDYCWWLIDSLLAYTSSAELPAALFPDGSQLVEDYVADGLGLPERHALDALDRYSLVLQQGAAAGKACDPVSNGGRDAVPASSA